LTSVQRRTILLAKLGWLGKEKRMHYDKQAVLDDWINKYWTAPHVCPICKEKDKWLLMDRIWELNEFYPRGVRSPTAEEFKVLPVVAVMCNNCGYTLFFNAIAVKAIPRSNDVEG
jgi:hypothetical protein